MQSAVGENKISVGRKRTVMRFLEIFRQNLVEGLGVFACRAFLRRLGAFSDISAVYAVPLYGRLLFEYFALCYILDELAVP